LFAGNIYPQADVFSTVAVLCVQQALFDAGIFASSP
jgi:hypothetical protein